MQKAVLHTTLGSGAAFFASAATMAIAPTPFAFLVMMVSAALGVSALAAMAIVEAMRPKDCHNC